MDRLQVSDPTDWQSTSLSSFTALDASLRCQVCKDFFNTAVITSCTHTFCSLCIRRCLATDGKCPTCRAGEQETRLRKNNAVQEATDAFVGTRSMALRIATELASAGKRALPSKRKREATDAEYEEPTQGRQTRSQKRRATLARSSSVDAMVVSDQDEKDEDFEPEDGLVSCPVCHKRMKEEAVFTHLDRCEEEPAEVPRSRRSQAASRPPLSTASGVTQPPAERLPQLNYSLMKDAALRKKLSELGIPTWGLKQLLIRRHTEWINLWNANCDSEHPRPRRELLKDLEVWERTQGGSAPDTGNSQSSVMRKDFDGANWIKKNKDDFDLLIASAKRKKQSSSEDKPPRVAGEEVYTSGCNTGIKEGYAQHAVLKPSSTVEPQHGKADDHPRTTSAPNSPGENQGSYQPDVMSTLDIRIHANGINAQQSPFLQLVEQLETLPEEIPSSRSWSPDGKVKKAPMFALPEGPAVGTDFGHV